MTITVAISTTITTIRSRNDSNHLMLCAMAGCVRLCSLGCLTLHCHALGMGPRRLHTQQHCCQHPNNEAWPIAPLHGDNASRLRGACVRQSANGAR
jgi:hypothetical protein